jgi:4'-phosphopantetheinyl transferase
MEPNLLHLWCAYPEDLFNEEACAALLSEDERVRWQRFRFERHRREYLATHSLLRSALSHYVARPAAEWRFTANEFGKPAIEPACGLEFNVSNSVEMVVCLVSESGFVGVDVEPVARAEAMLEVAPEVFSAAERAQLGALPPAEQLDRALSLWTLKEAYIKARGMGISLGLSRFSFLFGGGAGIRLETDAELNDPPERWRFCLLDRSGHRVAAVVEAQAAGRLEVLEARPVLAKPVKADDCAVLWFPRD